MLLLNHFQAFQTLRASAEITAHRPTNSAEEPNVASISKQATNRETTVRDSFCAKEQTRLHLTARENPMDSNDSERRQRSYRHRIRPAPFSSDQQFARIQQNDGMDCEQVDLACS